MFLRRTLDKIGVALEFEGVGLYKDAPDTFTETSPSPQTLEVTNQILDQYFGNLIEVIAQGRKRESAEIRAAIDRGPFVGKSAVDAGLIDEMLFEDEVYDRLEDQVNEEELSRVRSGITRTFRSVGRAAERALRSWWVTARSSRPVRIRASATQA